MQPNRMEELLMELSSKISAMQTDIEGIKSDMHASYIRSDENDSAVRELVEERSKTAKERQDAIKLELQGQINLLKKNEELQSRQNELYEVQIKGIIDELTALKSEKKNRIYSRWEQISDKAFWIVVAIIFGAIFKYINFTPPKPF